MEVNIDDHKPPNLDKVWEDAFYQVRTAGSLSMDAVSMVSFNSFGLCSMWAIATVITFGGVTL